MSEAPTSLAELFAMDPLELTLAREKAKAEGLPDPLIPIIERYRAARAQFALGQKQAGATKNVVPKAKGSEKLTLEDLGL
jgi:hypothetical protein